MQLTRGANGPLTSPSLTIAVSGARTGTVDLMAFQLTDDGRVRGDHDFVFFNQPASVEGGVRLTAGDSMALDLGAVPPEVVTIAVAVALDASIDGPLAGISALGVRVEQPGEPTIECPVAGLTTERAVVLLEVYRRGGGWKVRNVSAGWDGGLDDLVREHGVSVDDEPAPAAATAAPPAPPVPPAPPAPQSAASPAPGSRLSFEKRQVLDLRKKEVHKVLLTKDAASVRARVVLVLDKTGSMRKQYNLRVVHRVVERMVPVALQLDDDGTLEPYLYARSFLRLPDLTADDLEEWPETYLHLAGTHGGLDYDSIGHGNDEPPIISEILRTLRRGDPMPTLVLFFTDGGFSKRREITELVREASSLPAFWQFVGVGRANYGLLTTLDDLEGRVVDNVGFFELDDIDTVSDAELYARLLGEFPDWLRAARAAGITG
ncbi:VWA domain-containing protein [Sanguibacter sp. 25GB23B1]|uniref:VWA domain-containing protein n=1 Tax=unclassified Sanguibacter TaxID=2645534 RepID=UPI0032AF0CFB